MHLRLTAMAVALTALATSTPAAAQLIRSGSGASATSARDQFRVDLGGGTTAGANGSFGGVRREINWDGVPDGFAAPNSLPANFFNVNSPRGVTFTTAGTGFEVSANAGVAPTNFGNINPAYSTEFLPFSAQRLFTPIGINVFDILFFVPGTTTPALTTGFGAIFSDVDLANVTSIQLFGADNGSLGTFFAPAATLPDGGFSFLGISYTVPTISRVRITSGNAALGPNESGATDLVVLDDFLFGEPFAAVPEPSTWAMMLLGFVAIGSRARKRSRVAAVRA